MPKEPNPEKEAAIQRQTQIVSIANAIQRTEADSEDEKVLIELLESIKLSHKELSLHFYHPKLQSRPGLVKLEIKLLRSQNNAL